MSTTDFTTTCSSTSAANCNYNTGDCCAVFYYYQTMLTYNTPLYYCMTQAQRYNTNWGDYYTDSKGVLFSWYCLDLTAMLNSP